MTPVFPVMYAIAGLVLGGSIGYALGRRYVGDRRRLWLGGGGLMAVCVVANYFGVTTGYDWLRIGSVCAMAGAITGLKYGGLPEVRIWETPPPATRSAEHEDEPTPEETGAP